MKKRAAIKSALKYASQWLEFQQPYMPYVGAQLAVRLDGELILNEAFGLADISTATPLSVDHLFRIASHSKTFTGVACLQLVEAGKLRLDDVAAAHVPQLEDSEIGAVTVRELLGHGSGMTRDGWDSTFWSLDRAFPDEEELLRTIVEHGKVLEPNEHFKYSNIGYALLGLIIASASGTTYRDFVSRNIVDKLELANTGPDLAMDRIDELAKGYSSRAHGPDRVEIEHIDTFAESSATGFYSNAADLTAYFSAHLDGDDRLLSDASKRKMRQEQWRINDQSSYGLGLGITRMCGRTYYGHSGGYPGHITISKLDLERKLAVSVLTNANDGPAATVCEGFLRLIDLALTEKAKTEPRKRKKLRPFEGRFASLWGLTDVANIGGRLYMMMPTSQNPAADAVEMDVISKTELKPVGDEGFGGYGELMTYTFTDSGKVASIRGASGQRLVRADSYKLPAKVTRPT